MAAVQVGAPDRTLGVKVDLDELAKYGSVFAVGGAVLGGAGMLSVVAYLSAWNVPAPLIRLDPLTATLRADSVVWQLALLAVVTFGLDAAVRRLAAWPRVRLAFGVAVTVMLALLVADAVRGGFVGPVVSVVGGPVLAWVHTRGWAGPRATTALFALIALVAAFQTGAESGRLIRDQPVFQTAVTLTARVPVGGLDGATEAGGAWQYRGLYLVFRDGEAVYVSRPGAGARVWIVPVMHVMALGIDEARR